MPLNILSSAALARARSRSTACRPKQEWFAVSVRNRTRADRGGNKNTRTFVIVTFNLDLPNILFSGPTANNNIIIIVIIRWGRRQILWPRVFHYVRDVGTTDLRVVRLRMYLLKKTRKHTRRISTFGFEIQFAFPRAIKYGLITKRCVSTKPFGRRRFTRAALVLYGNVSMFDDVIL